METHLKYMRAGQSLPSPQPSPRLWRAGLTWIGVDWNKIRTIFLFLAVFGGTVGAMQQDDLGEQLLDAAKKGNCELVANLLDRGAFINYTSKSGWTALMRALDNNHEPVVQLLVDRGAVVTQADQLDHTPLMWAARWSRRSCCEIIVERLMRMPNEAQREKIYQLLMHMKRSGCINRDIRNLFKPLFLQIIEDENRPKPEQSIAFREIRKIKNESMKQKLLEKYTPIKNNNEVSNENK